CASVLYLNDPAPSATYPLSLHDALPIYLNKGDIAWTAANGDGPRNHPLLKPLNLPSLGNPGRGGLFATKTLLFVGEGDPVMVRADRKSTRLNSSHDQISYAVFCLKKKKK